MVGQKLYQGPKDHINARIQQTLVSGIALVLGLRAKRWDPDVDVVSGAAASGREFRTLHVPLTSEEIVGGYLCN